ncbi:MAG: ribosome small subunit-dependent GTPase A [Colwellia sp.]|nr:ribosome small subunit-dependent GTPase A [Colwellia sp.]
MSQSFTLSQMGWTAFFQQQLSLEQWETLKLGRVSAQHRGHLEIMTTTSSNMSLAINSESSTSTVGDWILMDEHNRYVQTLERFSLFSRKSAGSKVALQLIAANVNTAFIVCSLDGNFNLSRIERYLALVNNTGAEAVIVLTKADTCENVQTYVEQVRSLDTMLMVEAVDARETLSIKALKNWCAHGQTVVFIGSSGVGKSTLVNTLLNVDTQVTSPSRADDNRGRHTTTSRSLHLIPSGGLLLDTPGMRELQLVDCEDGIESTFSEIGELAEHCQFSNCQHQSEPGCAVKAAIVAGDVEQRRLTNYDKLLREQARNGATLAETRSKDRNLGRFYRDVQLEAKQRKGKTR